MENTQIPAITWLNMSGDITITWDESNKAAITALVKEKMAKGYSFFILKPRVLGIFGNKKVKLEKADDLDTEGSLVIEDADVQSMISGLADPAVQAAVASGKARLAAPAKAGASSNVVPLKAGNRYDTVRRASTAEEVVQHQSVAVRAVTGG